MKKVAIIGGGASGLLAGIMAARQGADVVILEGNDRVGKKILVTGNGKCNFTNLLLTEECYFTNEPNILKTVLEQFGVRDTVAFFENLGLAVKNRNGYLYPVSEQAATILDLLRLEVERLGITVLLEHKVKEIKKVKETFILQTQSGRAEYDKVIIACGGKAAPKTGSDGSGYQLAEKLGHTIVQPLPALVQLRCEESYFKSIAGVRMESRVTLVVNGKKEDSDIGELQLNDYGISGIPVFQISRNAAIALAEKKRVQVEIDLLPWLLEEKIADFIKNRLAGNKDKTAEEFLFGILHKKIIVMLLKQSRMSGNKKASEYTAKEWIAYINTWKRWLVTVKSTNPFENAQVCSGGVDLKEVQTNMESKLVKGLYFAGELLDVDGKCGGYNLQWAWSSGYVAGVNAAK